MIQGGTIGMSHNRVSIVPIALDLASRVHVPRRMACSRNVAGSFHLPGAALHRRAIRPAINASKHHSRGQHRQRLDSAHRIPGDNHAGTALMKSTSKTARRSLPAGGNHAIYARMAKSTSSTNNAGALNSPGDIRARRFIRAKTTITLSIRLLREPAPDRRLSLLQRKRLGKLVHDAGPGLLC